MCRCTYFLLLLLGLSSGSGRAQELPQIAQFLTQMLTAQLSDGWSVRAEIVQTMTGKIAERHFKIAIVGQVSQLMMQLWIRPISGDINKKQQYFLLSTSNGVQSLLVVDQLSHSVETHPVNFMTPLSDTGLYAFDVLNVWQQLPYHVWGASDAIGGRRCQNMRSGISENMDAGLHVINCVDIKNKLVLMSQVFDEQEKPVRITTIEKVSSDAKGRLQPQQALTQSSEQSTRVSIYSADAQYLVTPETFQPLSQYIATLHH